MFWHRLGLQGLLFKSASQEPFALDRGALLLFLYKHYANSARNGTVLFFSIVLYKV